MRYFIILIFIFQCFCIFSQDKLLSDKAQISLLTCSPGTELYSVFGHSALRVTDPENRIDRVYNYGTFSFDTPGFYMKFVRGQLNYQLSVTSFKYFMQEYLYYERSVYEQVLNIPLQNKQLIFNFVENNALPQNKYYQYDFFYDNCATRIRDVFSSVFADSIVFVDSLSNPPPTFRDLISIYLHSSPWAGIGINTILGMPTDKRVDCLEIMFLPDFLKDALSEAKIKTGDGYYKFVKTEKFLFNPDKKSIDGATPYLPTIILWFVFIVFSFLAWREFVLRKRFAFVDFFVFLFTGLVGLLICFLWFLSDHSTVVNNLNIIWAFPVNLVLLFFVARKNKPSWTRVYVVAILSFNVFLLFTWNFLPQDLDFRLIPLVLVVIQRLLLWLRRF